MPTEMVDEAAQALITRLRKENEELQQTLARRWEADQRAIKRWQAAHPGKEQTWPDHADLVVWLLEQIEGSGGDESRRWRVTATGEGGRHDTRIVSARDAGTAVMIARDERGWPSILCEAIRHQ